MSDIRSAIRGKADIICLLSSPAFDPRHSAGDLVTGLAFKDRRLIGPN
jgi:hypothetical protein